MDHKRIGMAVGLGLLTTVSAVWAAPKVEAPQGSVVRWADGSDSCGMNGKVWKAVQSSCYFPIDFEAPPGTVEIARWSGGTMESAWLRITGKDFGQQDIDFPDDRYVHPPQEDLEAHYQDQVKVKKVFRRQGEAKFTLPLGEPANPLPEGKYFGVERTFNGEPKNAHTGTDYAIGLDNSVLSVAAGKVVLVGEHFFAGHSVYVDHGNGLISMYFHLNSFSVEEGQEVARGDEVGKIGSTGRSTGPHLHLGLRWQGARIDPTPLVGSLQVIDVPAP